MLGDQSTYGATATQAATLYGVPPDLFSNLVGIESQWNPYAMGQAGEVGLGQIMPATASALGIDPYDPSQNLTGAAALLSKLFQQYKSWPAALSAYNSGSPNSQAGLSYAQQVLSGMNAAGAVVGPSLDPTTGLVAQAGQVGATASPGSPTTAISGLLQSAFGSDPTSASLLGIDPNSGLTSTPDALALQQGLGSNPWGITGADLAKYGTAGLLIVLTIALGLYLVSKSTAEKLRAAA